MPTRDQVVAACAIAVEAAGRLGPRIEVIHVVPDYFGDRPKPCMNGWGQRQLTVDPVGDVLPCPTAREIPSLRFENVRDRPLRAIWEDSEAFNRFRGTSWMPEPCRSCDRRYVDFGGCRCQAFLLTGDASATDPACSLSPHRESLTRLIELAETPGRGSASSPVCTRPGRSAWARAGFDPSKRRCDQSGEEHLFEKKITSRGNCPAFQSPAHRDSVPFATNSSEATDGRSSPDESLQQRPDRGEHGREVARHRDRRGQVVRQALHQDG